ncbi:uncharacterized protein LOC132169390 [Corylus avellana]|uniref:uncharacterized protein LOC132169390 n=1 Tax=Corylus avellana TaxID=13451 RepID=UPI00286C9C85|nr:uncharacterized protein LOC132169390 [Corylus avellana]
MASEDPSHALSPGIGHQTEEDGTIIQDHTAPIVVSDLMGKNEATENESNSIDDHTVEQGTGWAREEAKDYNENEVDISFVNTEMFKNEVRSRRIAMEDEVQRGILDSLVTWFLCEEEMVDNENKEEEEEEEDKYYSLHREFLLDLENWDGGKEKKNCY